MRQFISILALSGAFLFSAIHSEGSFFATSLNERPGRVGAEGRSSNDLTGHGGIDRNPMNPSETDTFPKDRVRSQSLIRQSGDRADLNSINLSIGNTARADLDQASDINYDIDPSFADIVAIQTSTPVKPEELHDISQDEPALGVQWFLKNRAFGARLAIGADGSINSRELGHSPLFENTRGVAVWNALNGVTDVDVNSSPSFVVRDSDTSSLPFGEEVQITTQAVYDHTNGPQAAIIGTVAFRETGVLLNMRPRVSESGPANLDIEQEVSDVAATTLSGTQGPTIRQRRGKAHVRITPHVIGKGNEARRTSRKGRARPAKPDAFVGGKPPSTGVYRLLG